jgi:predicted TIM-barrel fold metal-dependent hydrolase
MTTTKRPPESREEDAWLSDEQLEHVAPAEEEAFHAPVPTRMVSNGEYMPHPQTAKQKRVEARVKELATRAAKRLNVGRRKFLESTGGLAASFIAMNEVYGQNLFKVSEGEMYDDDHHAVNGPPRDLFVFDDQTHIVRTSNAGSNALRALAQGPGAASTAGGFTKNPFNGAGGNPLGVDELGGMWTPWNPTQLHPDAPPNPGPNTTVQGEFHLGQYINRLYLQSQTNVSIISNANFALFSAPGEVPRAAKEIAESLQNEILTGWQTSQCRDYINALAGSTRALAHAQIYPGRGNIADPQFGDYTQWQIENMSPDSWKGYNVAPAASAAPGNLFAQWRLDDETIAYPTYEIIARNRHQLKKHPGFFNICIHKGLSPSPDGNVGTNNRPEFGNPDDLVKACTDWPMFNWIMYHSCFRPSFWDLQAFLDLERLPGAQQPTMLWDSDGHGFPNIRWSTQFAQIAAGKYLAGGEPTSNSPSSPKRLQNLYAELGTTMASMIVTFPTVFAHLIGQLLYYMGEDHIVYGSDSIWYGGPQWQIEAFWRFQIPESIRRTWGYPQLTERAKRKILGLNSARLYGMRPRDEDESGQGRLPTFATAPALQPGGRLDAVLNGPGYPVPVVPAQSLPQDRFSQIKGWADELKLGRSNSRNGWIRT